MEIKLSDLRTGQQACLLDIPQDCPVKARLAQFGIGAGALVRCRFFSPGRHLLALEWDGTLLAVRRKDLTGITARLC